MVFEPLSNTLLRMSREQLAAALLEIASPQKSPWLVYEGHDVVISLTYSIHLLTASFLFR